jgi:hypothetical protein
VVPAIVEQSIVFRGVKELCVNFPLRLNISPSALFSNTKLSNKFVISFCALLVLSVQAESSNADSRFIYTAKPIEFRQTFAASIDLQGQSYTTDLNGDGATDVILTGATYTFANSGPRGPQPGLILFNNGDNTFTIADGDVPGSEEARDVLTGDFNGDGIIDIYIADHGWDTAPFPGFKNQLLLGTGTGFTEAGDRLPDIEAFSHNGAVGDIDGDGDIDLFSMNSDQIDEELSYLLINDGDANFTFNRQRLPDSLNSVANIQPSYAAEIADLDGDGFPELIIGHDNMPDAVPTRIHWNDGSGFYSDTDVSYLADADIFNGLANIQIVEIKGVDVNGDGRKDVLVHGYNATTFDGINLQLFINQGDREFTDETLPRLTSAAQDPNPSRGVPFRTKFVDINGDGIADILPEWGGDISDNGIVLFEGTGHGCFSPITMQSVTEDPDVRSRLWTVRVFSAAGLGFAQFFPFTENNKDVIGFNYVPINIQAAAPVANLFSTCRGKIEVSLDYERDLYALDFSIISTEPSVVIQADVSSVRKLTESMENPAIFSSADGILTLPNLVLAGQVAFRNLKFQLTDGKPLLFKLLSFE